MEAFDGFGEHGEMAGGFASTATGKYQKYPFIVADTVGSSERSTIPLIGPAFEDGMANIGGGEAVLFEIGRLKRQERKQMIKKAGNFLGASGPPRPDTGCDKMHKWDSLLGQSLRHSKIEVW